MRRGQGGEKKIKSNNHTIAQVHFMCTRISLPSFSILLSSTSSLWKISHPSASGFRNLCCLTLCQIPFSPIHYWVVCSSLMGIGWISHPCQCFTLFLYQVKGLMLLPSHPHAPAHTSCSSSPSFLLLSPTKLSCPLAVYMMSCLSVSSPHFPSYRKKLKTIPLSV